jgi:hypothetical protein
LLGTEGKQDLLAIVLLATEVKHRAKTAHHRKASKEFSPLRQRVKCGGEKELSLSLAHVVPGRVQGKRLVVYWCAVVLRKCLVVLCCGAAWARLDA